MEKYEEVAEMLQTLLETLEYTRSRTDLDPTEKKKQADKIIESVLYNMSHVLPPLVRIRQVGRIVEVWKQIRAERG